MLLPGADHTTEGVMARLDRLERRAHIEGVPAAAQPVQSPPRAASRAAEPRVVEPVETPSPRVAESPAPVAAPEPRVVEPVETPAPRVTESPAPVAAPEPRVTEAPAAPPQPAAPAPRAEPDDTPAASGGLGLVEVRRLWPDLLEAVKLKRRYTWILLSQNAQVAAVDDKTLTIALVNAGARNSFSSGGSEEILRQAAIDVIGHDWRIEAIVDPSAQPGAEGETSSGPVSTYSPTRPEDVAAHPAADAAPADPEPERRRGAAAAAGRPGRGGLRPRGDPGDPGPGPSSGPAASPACPTRTPAPTTPTPRTTSAAPSCCNVSSGRTSSKRSSTTERERAALTRQDDQRHP